MKERLVVCLLWRCGVTSLRHFQCVFALVFATDYENSWYLYRWTFCVSLITSIVQRLENRLNHVSSTRYLYSNVWRLVDSEFDKLNSLFFFFIKKPLVIPGGLSNMSCYLICLRKIQFYLMSFGTICVLSLTFKIYLYNLLSTYALVMLSLQLISKQYVCVLPEWL